MKSIQQIIFREFWTMKILDLPRPSFPRIKCSSLTNQTWTRNIQICLKPFIKKITSQISQNIFTETQMLLFKIPLKLGLNFQNKRKITHFTCKKPHGPEPKWFFIKYLTKHLQFSYFYKHFLRAKTSKCLKNK